MKEKHYGIVDEIVHFDRRGCGPLPEQIQVWANVDPNRNYPSARISVESTGKAKDPLGMDHVIGTSTLGTLCFTVEQAKALRKKLGEAIADVLRACPQIEVDDLDDGAS